MGVRRNQSVRSGLPGHHSDAGSAQRSLTTAPSMKLSTAEAAMSITSGKAG
jgi:outer membrane scaffolding protein for murein synthesis (MipA/OmpV family)